MGSMWANLRQETVAASKAPTMVSELEETDPYYFVALDENNATLSEGELSWFKFRLPDEYLNKEYKSISRNPETLVAIIHF